MGQTAILQSQAARKWLGEEREPQTRHFFQEKKKTLVILQAHIPALDLKSKHCSTKNLKRGNETTALSAPRFRKCWQLGMDKPQENNLTLNSSAVKSGARHLSSKYESPVFIPLSKGSKWARIKAPSFRHCHLLEQDTTGSQCQDIPSTHCPPPYCCYS